VACHIEVLDMYEDYMYARTKESKH